MNESKFKIGGLDQLNRNTTIPKNHLFLKQGKAELKSNQNLLKTKIIFAAKNKSKMERALNQAVVKNWSNRISSCSDKSRKQSTSKNADSSRKNIEGSKSFQKYCTNNLLNHRNSLYQDFIFPIRRNVEIENEYFYELKSNDGGSDRVRVKRNNTFSNVRYNKHLNIN